MKASLRALLSGLIDYAGLFPPAQLPLEEAIRSYARYRTEPESWMLGRFLCPAARLVELTHFEELWHTGPPFAFAALGRGGNISEEFVNGLIADMQAIRDFGDRYGDRVAVEVLEVRLPAYFLEMSNCPNLGEVFTNLRGFLRAAGVTPFYEVPYGTGWRDQLSALIPALHGGFKLRCGGLEASAFPTPEQVAFALTTCLREARPFKATAGLHHPFRRLDPQLGVKIHGFVNVFGAGVLASALDLSEEQVQTIIEDEHPSHFVFTDTEFRWKDLVAPLKAIERARRDRIVSFGSCSFDEPREDLRALGLL